MSPPSELWALVLAGGPGPVPIGVLGEGRRPDLVIAADGGLAHAEELMLTVDVVVGDLDSARPAEVAAARAAGAAVEHHPADKDATDLELALDAAVARGAGRITAVGIAGGRADHHLANVLLLAHPKYRRLQVEGFWGGDLVAVVRDSRRLVVPIGSLVTVLPVGGPAEGVWSQGLRWPLAGDVLAEGTSRGVSNVATEAEVTVRVDRGTVVVIVPSFVR